MKFTFLDRLVINRIYPNETDILTQILIRDLDKKLSFTQEELTSIDFETKNNKYIWDEKKANNLIIDVELTEKELELLKQGVENLDKAKKVTPILLDLCLKIKNE